MQTANQSAHGMQTDQLFRVLIVEDNPADQFLIREFLKRGGFEEDRIASATTLAEAQDAIIAFAPDAAVLDLFLPDAQGISTVQTYLQFAGGIPVVVLSATEDETIAMHAVRLGAQDYLVKGRVTPALLHRSLRYAIERQQLLAERILVEETLRQKTAELEDFIENASICLRWMDAQGRILWANRTELEFFGYSKEQYFGRSAGDFHADAESWLAFLDQIQQGREVRNLEARVRLRDGQIRHVSINANLHSKNGAFVHVRCFTRDITDRKTAEQMNQYLAQTQKMEAISGLAGGIAHDFNNLLMVIRGHCELLQMHGAPPHVTECSTNEILAATDKAAALTRQLLAFSRQQPIELRIMELGDIVNNLRGLPAGVLGSNIELRLEETPGLGKIKADPAQITEVLLNLLFNARDAMPNGGTVTVRTFPVAADSDLLKGFAECATGNHVGLEVCDRGIGMDQQTLDRAFEPFFTTKEFGKGTGLGLASAYGVVKQHGAQISINSKLGEGTQVRIFFPACEPADPAAPRLSLPPDVHDFKPTILVVEDEPALLSVTSQFLQMEGYRVLEAPGGAEALEIAQTFPENISLLITDVVMPKMKGHELAARLALLRPGMRVLFASGYNRGMLAEQGITGGQSQVLRKPYAREELLSKVREVLAVSVGPAATP